MSKIVARRQLAILEFIYNYVNQKGYPPTVREIGQAVNLASTSTVHGYLARLQKQGYLQKDPTKPRAIEVTQQGCQALGIQPTNNQIPVVGTVTAGNPILAVEETTDYFPLPPGFDSAQDLFMLTIRGESMINIGILDGDQVIVKKQSTAQNGDIVIAMTAEDEATCKRFFKEDGRYRLQPENDALEPFYFDYITILGKVIGLYRSVI